MKNAGLLRAAYAAAMLATIPAYAQTNTQTESTGTNNSVVAPATPQAATPGAQAKDTMSPRSNMAKGDAMQHGTMSAHSGMHAGRSDTSQDAAVDRLNQQSFEAAQRGESFSAGASASGSGGMMNGGSGQTDTAGHSKM